MKDVVLIPSCSPRSNEVEDDHVTGLHHLGFPRFCRHNLRPESACSALQVVTYYIVMCQLQKSNGVSSLMGCWEGT